MLLLSIVVIAISCSKEEIEINNNQNQAQCDSLSQLEPISIKASSAAFIPYPDTISTLIFSDTAGQEYVGVVSFYDFMSTITYSGLALEPNIPCPIDSSILINYQWTTELKMFIVEFEELNIRIRLSVRPLRAPNSYTDGLLADYCSFILTTGLNYSELSSQMTIIVDSRNHPMPFEYHSDFQPQYNLHDETYENVYIQNITDNEKYQLLYNTEFGILGFKGGDDPAVDLKFVRYE